MANSSSFSTTPAAAPTKSFARRIVFPIFLAANFALGVYTLVYPKEKSAEDNEMKNGSSPTTEKTGAVTSLNGPVTETTQHVSPPANVLPPISVHDQRQLLKWILDEKRKVKATDPSDKKKLDEEKAILKHYICAKSLPDL